MDAIGSSTTHYGLLGGYGVEGGYRPKHDLVTISVVDPLEKAFPPVKGLLWMEDLETDDYIELWCENNGAALDIIIVNATLGVS